MKYKKGSIRLMVIILFSNIALQLFMTYIEFFNMPFRFCLSAAIMCGLCAVDQFIRRDDLFHHILDYCKGDHEKAKEYYRSQMKFTWVFVVLTTIFIIAGVFTLF